MPATNAAKPVARQLTPDEAIEAVTRVAAHVPVQLVADDLGVPVELVHAAISRAKASREARGASSAADLPGVPSARNGVGVDVVRPVAPVAPKPRVDAADLMDIEELCRWADGAGVNRAAVLAGRIRDAAEELRAMAKRRGEIDEHKARIAKLEAALAKERAALAEASGGRSSGGKSTATAPKGETAKIREWACANGYEVRDLGLVAKPIVEAYQRAHGLEVG